MRVHSKIRDYSVDIVDDLLGRRLDVLSDFSSARRFYFIDREVFNLYDEKLKAFVSGDSCLLIDARESNKEYVQLAEYYRALIENGFMRNDVLITIGGGILQDISGFVASTLYRGVRWVFCPTTLLAQADSCIGSKTSINFGDSKNLIGTFYPPDLILIDAGFCRTLPDQFFNSGLGEIIKFHLMSDEAGYDRLRRYLSVNDFRNSDHLKEMILSTLEIKRSYFEGDEFDTGRRNLLNYGHCFGHALESASGFAVSHGEAVLVGMGFANLLSLKRGIMAPAKHRELEQLLRDHYPDFDLADVSVDAIIRHLRRDKKRLGKDLTMILARDIGRQYKFDDVTEPEIRETYDDFVKRYPGNLKEASRAIE